MQKLIFIRHGLTDWNEQKLMQGRADISLNEKGVDYAQKLAKKINLNEVDVVLCSPLKRAKQTAEIIVENKKEIVIEPLVIERSFGDLEGKMVDSSLMYKHWDYKLNNSEFNIECLTDLLKRAKMFLNKVKTEYPNKTVMVVTHGCFIKAIHFNMVGYDENTDFLSFFPDNMSVNEYYQ